MGRVLPDYRGFEFYIFPNDHGWPHVHVYKAEGYAKIAIGNERQPPWAIEVSRKMRNSDVERAIQVIAENQETLTEQWRKYRG